MKLLAVCVSLLVCSIGVHTAPDCSNGQTTTVGQADDMYNDMYYTCLFGKPVAFLCPRGTVFDKVSRRCVVTSCQVGAISRTVCCDQYMECNAAGVWTIKPCPVGTAFEPTTNQCVADDTTCTAHALCPPRVRLSPTDAPCTLRAIPDQPCKFRQLDAYRNDLGAQNCAEGTAFNQTTCSCSIGREDCKIARPMMVSNALIDVQCRATLVMDFDRMPIRSYTLKTTNGQRQDNGYAIDHRGSQVVNSEAFIQVSENGPGYLSIPHFQENIMRGSFVMSVTFKLTNPRDGQSFVVLGNDMLKADLCPPTLSLKATYTQGALSLTLSGVGMTPKATMTTVTPVTQSVSLSSTPNYVNARIIFDSVTRRLSAVVQERGGSPTTLGPLDIGASTLAYNQCPLYVGYNMFGSISDVQLFEACGNVANAKIAA